MNNPRMSPRVAVTLIAVFAASISLGEWRALYKLDHPPPRRVSCVTCHSDAKTLAAIADKAGDPLYLVNRGDLPLPPGHVLTKPPESK